MHPVRDFKANFSLPVKTEPTTEDGLPDTMPDVLLHEADSSTRNLCFVWDDGRKAFFNYAYLMTVELTVQEELNVLRLSFGAYTVIVKGYSLGVLFDLLLEHAPKTVTAINPRYVTPQDSRAGIVLEILVKSE